MGYEVVEENSNKLKETLINGNKEEVNMDKQARPRICEVLGVEVGECFCIKGFCEKDVDFCIENDGTFSTRPSNVQGSSVALLRTLDHPDRIIRKPRFTEQEVERAKAIKMIYPNAYRLKNSDVFVQVWGKEGILLAHAEVDLFPSLRPGQPVELDEIIGGAK